MIRRVPLIATLIVLIAAGIMIRLGFWQLDRLHQKQMLLDGYAAAARAPPPVAWPRDAAEARAALYRRSSVTCAAVTDQSTLSGRNRAGEAGMAHVVTCSLADADAHGATARVVLGWSRDPALRDWRGGTVAGIVAPGPRLIADPPQAGLDANEQPDPADIPNNHLSYAVQWFLFAGVAVVIYALALRKRLAGGAAGV